jgi:putative inorganic carbon (HCO3(-)) transporter
LLFLILNTQNFASKLNERSSISSRLIIWKSTNLIIRDNPFWGIGPSNFQKEYLKHQAFFPPYLEWAVPHPHNVYLTFWLGGGILALVGWMGIILNMFLKFFNRANKKALMGALAILAYFLIHGLVDTTYFKNDLAIIFWLAYFKLL